MLNDTARDALKSYVQKAVMCQQCVDRILAGRTVEVVSDFNDQQYGRSKKSLKGRQFKVRYAFLDLTGGGEIHMILNGCSCAVALGKDVVVIS